MASEEGNVIDGSTKVSPTLSQFLEWEMFCPYFLLPCYNTRPREPVHMCVYVCVCSVVSDSLQPHRLQFTRLLCPWNYSGKNTGVGCLVLLQGLFPTQGLNLCLLPWQVDSLPLSHLKSSINWLFTYPLKSCLCIFTYMCLRTQVFLCSLSFSFLE